MDIYKKILHTIMVKCMVNVYNTLTAVKYSAYKTIAKVLNTGCIYIFSVTSRYVSKSVMS